MSTRVRRRWVVGIVSCDDIKALQLRINQYRSALGTSFEQLPADQKGTTGPHGELAWKALTDRCAQYENEECYLGLFAGSQFDRGRALVTELDGWRDWLASIKAPSLPEPVPVPHAQASLFGATANMGVLLAVLAGLYILKK